MVFPRPRRRWPALGMRIALVGALAVLVLVPTGAFDVPRNSSTTYLVTSQAHPSAAFTASVTWNGVNVDTAGSASSALSVSFSSSATVLFQWTTPAGQTNPNDARLQMFYFGFALETRDVVNSGTQDFANMTWTPTAISYILEGVYEITASLITPSGSTVWSENFWVRANAPYSILAVLPIILILIIAWELYSVALSGRQAALSQKPKAPPSPPEQPPAQAGTEPESTPPPSAGEWPPPSQGGESP